MNNSRAGPPHFQPWPCSSILSRKLAALSWVPKLPAHLMKWSRNFRMRSASPGLLRRKIYQPKPAKEKATWRSDQISLITEQIGAFSLKPTVGSLSTPFTPLAELTAFPKKSAFSKGALIDLELAILTPQSSHCVTDHCLSPLSNKRLLRG